MKLKKSFWMVSVLAYAVSLSACAVNNEIVIESKQTYQSDFAINGFEFRFPPQSHIGLVPLYGSPWRISGDISDIIRDAMSEISLIDFEGLATQSGSFIDLQDIKIVYQATTPGGVNSILSVGLDFQFVGKYKGVHVDSCQVGRVIPTHSPPIHHGLFASRDKMRTMIQPVYENLIKEALTQALVAGLNCLSRESDIALKN